MEYFINYLNSCEPQLLVSFYFIIGVIFMLIGILLIMYKDLNEDFLAICVSFTIFWPLVLLFPILFFIGWSILTVYNKLVPTFSEKYLKIYNNKHF